MPMSGCHLRHVDLSRATGSGEVAATGCRLGSMSLYGTRTGDVEISGSSFTDPSVTVQCDLATIEGAFYCHDAVLDGQLRLPGAHVTGYLELDGTKVAATTGCIAASGTRPNAARARSRAISICGARGSSANCGSTAPG